MPTLSLKQITQTLQSLAPIYKEKGVCVIPDVFSDFEMAELKHQAYMTESSPGYPHSAIEYKGNKKALIFFPSLGNSYIDKIRKDERLATIAKFFLGENIKQVNNQIYFRESGDGDEFAWHQDIRFRTPRERFPGIEDGYLQTIIAVDDIDETNGGIEFIEGTHFTEEPQDNNLRNFVRNGRKGIKYKVKKGSVMCWHVLTVHGSEQNVSDRDRMTYMNGFAKAENCLDYPYYMKDGKVVDLEPNLIP